MMQSVSETGVLLEHREHILDVNDVAVHIYEWHPSKPQPP